MFVCVFDIGDIVRCLKEARVSPASRGCTKVNKEGNEAQSGSNQILAVAVA